MIHARESLATLLTKPGKRCNANSLSETSYFQMVCQLLSDIEVYRNRGYSLGEIHGALVRGGDIGCALGTFKAYYYRARQLANRSALVSDLSIENSGLPQNGNPDKGSQTRYVTSKPIGETPSLSLSETGADIVPTAESEEKSLLNISETELKAQQALAKRMFAQRRAELGITRRED